MWNEITYPFSNFKGLTVEGSECDCLSIIVNGALSQSIFLDNWWIPMTKVSNASFQMVEETSQVSWRLKYQHPLPWWRHQMEIFPRYWSPVNSPHKGQWRGALVFFDLRLNKQLSKQSWSWWFETPSFSLWRHCNGPLFLLQARLLHCLGCLTNNPPTIHYRIMDDSRVYRIPLNDERSLHEVMVPTCNYRMGTRSMGYGAAVFSE